ncbi:Putative lipase atg15 [Lodderomyces elongisporus]|uniref:Putative lipase atg15 n=1 Tax=Lodderomyces elongisporus TaxID=36914 RepID=UPI002923987A|nr:Putative lipase atg15 [Lodderomyces elongisporus]WLF81690.1 Putative lipase atg15 [Lodderomyces elongisporus]
MLHITEKEQTRGSRQSEKRGKRLLPPSIKFIWFCLISAACVAATTFYWLRLSPVHNIHKHSLNSSFEDKGEDGTLQLKHIFHHGVGEKDYKIHKRLDVTQEYLIKHSAYFQNMVNEQQQEVQEIQEIHKRHEKQEIQVKYGPDQEYNQTNTASNSVGTEYKSRLSTNEYDWPDVHRGKNPFDIQLPFKNKQSIARRIKHRNEPFFIESYLDYARSVNGDASILNRINLEWIDDDINIPNITDKDTIVTLATISSNAYVRFPQNDDDKKKSDWTDVGGGWIPDEENNDVNFGWEDVGLRGHIFVSKDNKTVVIGIKGTSGAGLPGGGSDETTKNDKTNDNLLFSCCCARVGYMWTTVCDCYEKAYTCNQDCLEKELRRKDRYYEAALDIYKNVTAIYPPETTDIWVTGHSLGGALASLLGRTYGLPTVAYEAPGEMLASKRLHLPQAPGLPRHLEHIWHIGNTADPIYMGVCNGASSSCSLGGYAMETACHTGYQCVYDVVTDYGWRVNLLNHRIHTVIDDIILVYNETAPCVYQAPCRDCFNWRFVSHDDKE